MALWLIIAVTAAMLLLRSFLLRAITWFWIRASPVLQAEQLPVRMFMHVTGMLAVMFVRMSWLSWSIITSMTRSLLPIVPQRVLQQRLALTVVMWSF